MSKKKYYIQNEWEKYYRNEKILNILLVIQLILVIMIIIGWILLAYFKMKGY